ncbi:C40 family peptidase [Synechocystis salina]|uniref:C40 family peptidase n=1 Tax=Synechocystis salina LEGE 00031 TaxID=1828736 RepID=A0ABR9VVQ8_9SYNC|nr:C40 family peptidase [Synechocystis salina]MBE9242037.1 C40 family peptidase [Synechocystis salina LEGE 00041]MBE9254528.1 C40 family peptidase [Synechocystis salina LEGE 00031]
MTGEQQFTLPASPTGQFICQQDLNLYDGPDRQELSTQAKQGRYLRLTGKIEQSAVLVEQAEDGYRGWLAEDDLRSLTPAFSVYQAVTATRADIEQLIPQVIDYLLAAKQRQNYYLWGGNVGPNYDCSGLMQAAFASQGIWLPRDSYQQAAFCQTIVDVRPQRRSDSLDAEKVAAIAREFLPGDLIFFGNQRVDHVGMYLGEGKYIHSSGQTHGRNGIGMDSLTNLTDPISHKYFQKWWFGGRVVKSFNPVEDYLANTDIAVDTRLLK